MEQITSMILTGLIAGASGIATGALQEIGRQAYDGLKARVVAHLQGKGKVESALDLLEDEPESGALQARLKKELAEGIAAEPAVAQDAALLAAAQELLELLEKADLPTSSAVKISLVGSGAIASGTGATAAGERGVVIGGNADGSTIITGDNQAVDDA